MMLCVCVHVLPSRYQCHPMMLCVCVHVLPSRYQCHPMMFCVCVHVLQSADVDFSALSHAVAQTGTAVVCDTGATRLK